MHSHLSIGLVVMVTTPTCAVFISTPIRSCDPHYNNNYYCKDLLLTSFYGSRGDNIDTVLEGRVYDMPKFSNITMVTVIPFHQ